ncbi:AAA family ATPase [Corynebacterium glutamicum]|uniref:AAA family ATPase n=1 Tax=Corynebacterium glutamicum TaxID=1718 RepID=UPI000744A96C|nr:ATP-binding protein [Corynebacterium glutamicum]ALZ99154.1 AAA family ATPase [Corynebacterium glutamicum]
MAASGEHITALVNSHASGDDASFYSIALQISAQEARKGHHLVANDIKQAVDASREQRRTFDNVISLPNNFGEISELAEVTFPEVHLNQLVASPEIKDQLRQVMAEQRQRSRLLEFGFTPAHRLLLEGPPGTGKTMTASVLATELSLPMFTIRLDSLLSKYMGETAGKLRIIFEAIAQYRGVFLFDEFDALGGDRSGNDVGEARRILNSFLVFLESSSPNSIVIAATNHRPLLDKALFRRFDAILTYQLPNAAQAENVIKARLGSLINKGQLSGLSQLTKGLSHAELVKAAEQAAKSAIMRGEVQVSRKGLEIALMSRRKGSIGLTKP